MERSKTGYGDPRTQRQTQQYILLVFFLPYPRSDAEENGNLETPMGPDKKNLQEKLPPITKAQGRTQPNKTEHF